LQKLYKNVCAYISFTLPHITMKTCSQYAILLEMMMEWRDVRYIDIWYFL